MTELERMILEQFKWPYSMTVKHLAVIFEHKIPERCIRLALDRLRIQLYVIEIAYTTRSSLYYAIPYVKQALESTEQ